MERTLSYDEARAFYDAFGARQDTQGYYEDPPNRDLVDHLALDTASAVLELGCGTGRLAAEMLLPRLPAGATYLGVDVSQTMVSLARARLSAWRPRATVELAAGPMTLPGGPASVDRFVSTYVLDLLATEDIRALAAELTRVLAPGGLAGITSLTGGRAGLPRVVSWIWRQVQRRRPTLVGGCRPLDLAPLMRDECLELVYEGHHCVRALSSQVLVLRRV